MTDLGDKGDRKDGVTPFASLASTLGLTGHALESLPAAARQSALFSLDAKELAGQLYDVSETMDNFVHAQLQRRLQEKKLAEADGNIQTVNRLNEEIGDIVQQSRAFTLQDEILGSDIQKASSLADLRLVELGLFRQQFELYHLEARIELNDMYERDVKSHGMAKAQERFLTRRQDVDESSTAVANAIAQAAQSGDLADMEAARSAVESFALSHSSYAKKTKSPAPAKPASLSPPPPPPSSAAYYSNRQEYSKNRR